jgi:hypothetical protein
MENAIKWEHLDIIVPDQTWMSGATRRKDPVFREKRLMAAILEDHVRCLLKRPVAEGCSNRTKVRERIAEEELEWLYTDGIWCDEKRGVSSDYVFTILGLSKKEFIGYLENNKLLEVLRLAQGLKKQWLKRIRSTSSLRILVSHMF